MLQDIRDIAQRDAGKLFREAIALLGLTAAIVSGLFLPALI
jgi:hypothetical protein